MRFAVRQSASSPISRATRALTAAFVLAAACPPASYSVETEVVEFHPNNKLIRNVLGKKRGEPKVIDLSGEHIIRLPGGEKYEYIELSLQIRHLESGKLEVQKATADYKWRRDYLTDRDVPIFLTRAGGRLSNSDVRLWIEGVGAGLGSIELDLVLAGSVDTSTRKGKLDLTATGEFAADDGMRPRKFQFFRRSEAKTRSPQLLVNLEIWTQIEYNFVVEGGVTTVEGRQNAFVSNWGYFPYLIRLKRGEVGAPPIASPRCPLAIPRTSWIEFKMNRRLAITELKGKVGGQNISYSAP